MKHYPIAVFIVGLLGTVYVLATPGDQPIVALVSGGLLGHGGWLLVWEFFLERRYRYR